MKTENKLNDFFNAVGEMALFGLLATALGPDCDAAKPEAMRVLFASPPSTEKKQLAYLLAVDLTTLDERIKRTLTAAGYDSHEPETPLN